MNRACSLQGSGHGETIATRNDLLDLMWAPVLRTLEEYQAAQDRGEAAKVGNPDFAIVQGSDNSAPTAPDLGLDRQRLSEIRKVARAGGWPLADW